MNMSNKIYNWGIIGLGKIARKFAADLQVLPNARLQGVASRSFEKAESFAKEFDVPYFFSSYEELMQCPDLDVVYIATPHNLHCENTLLCLNNNIPVLCEKPFAMNAKEVRQMVDLARANQTFLMEAMWTRFMDPIRKTLELIAEGKIGRLISIKADFGFKASFDPTSRLYDQKLGGGALMDIGIYPVFLSLLLFGEPDVIKAMASIGSTNVDEDCAILMKYNNKRMALLHSTINADTKCEAHIFGEKGHIHIHPRWHERTSMSLHLEGEEPQFFFFEYESNGYSYEAREVMQCLANGKKESEKMPLDFSTRLIKLLDAIRKEAGIFYAGENPYGGSIPQKGSTSFSWN